MDIRASASNNLTMVFNVDEDSPTNQFAKATSSETTDCTVKIGLTLVPAILTVCYNLIKLIER
jgi:hypothetical protein